MDYCAGAGDPGSIPAKAVSDWYLVLGDILIGYCFQQTSLVWVLTEVKTPVVGSVANKRSSFRRLPKLNKIHFSDVFYLFTCT